MINSLATWAQATITWAQATFTWAYPSAPAQTSIPPPAGPHRTVQPSTRR